MRTNKDRIDFGIRIFLLRLLDNRELTFSEIRGCIARDYHDRTFPRQDVRHILKLLLGYGMVTRRALDADEKRDLCGCVYTTTDKGRRRAEYYEKQLRIKNEAKK